MVFMDTEVFSITRLKPAEYERAARFFAYRAGSDDESALRRNMADGGWSVLLATAGEGEAGGDVGGAYVNWKPKYRVYQRMDLPELQDLRVNPDWRGQGIATAIIAKAETMARDAQRVGLGLSVGLHAGYGAAQRLYAGLGYIPDGNGVTYDREAVQAGARTVVDDDLALMLLKFF